MTSTEVLKIPVQIKEETIYLSCLYRPGNNGPLVYLHGLGSTKYDFLDAYHSPGFKDYLLLTFDFPGSGSSDYPKNHSLTIPDIVKITQQVLVHFEIEAVNLIGHSMGGLIGLLLAKSHPSRITSFINVEGNIAPEDCSVFSRKTAQLSWERFIGTDYISLLQEEFSQHSNTGAKMFADRLLYSVQPRTFYDYCRSIVKLSDSGTLMETFLSLKNPSLFIHGEENNHLSYLPHLRKTKIKVAEIKNSNHWPHLDQPGYFRETINSFINST